ncbi:DUF2312 domain-containing protein [Sinorhizobium meliloti]|uniref:DUF2312 domain-containing protein n=1 Tax=Rhizobium meliloti TaxID=382 RepID=UPI000B49FA1C|nr:DUF2312 domain-containing protein [Sinorhizobium meliloti]MQW26301.1 DUF2312 domain-containing protein [Sinorhizobium meliloti]
MTDAHGVARDQLRAFIGRIERLEEEKKTIAEDIKDVYGEAKSMGFDAKILRKVISIRKQDADERAEQEAILDTYLHALGMIQIDMFEEPEEAHDPETGEILDDAPVTVIDHTDADGHHLTVTVDPQVAAILARSDGGLNIVTKHSEIATASQGGTASPSPDAELSSAGANAGGEDVDRSAERASVATSSGPDVKWAQISPEEAMQSLGDGDTDIRTDDAVGVAVTGTGTPRAGVTVVGTESGTVSQLTKPKYVLRPHCLNPGETCGGYSDKHCHACTVAMRKREQAEEFA